MSEIKESLALILGEQSPQYSNKLNEDGSLFTLHASRLFYDQLYENRATINQEEVEEEYEPKTQII